MKNIRTSIREHKKLFCIMGLVFVVCLECCVFPVGSSMLGGNSISIFINFATKEEEYADWGHPSQKYHEKSHGESFLALAQNQLRPNGLYLFDEPEAALSPQRQLTLLMEICSCAKQGSQFIIVTHSPILLGIPGAQIISFDDGFVHNCEYEDTESYKVTEMFINNREILLQRLLSE